MKRICPDTSLNYKSSKQTTIVLIVGESLRADHLSINGYNRNTTPLLEKQQNIISLKNIYSQYTYTNPSVAHILTRADSVNTDRAKTEMSFISLFRKCSYYTAWLANQDAALTYYPFMLECDTLIYARPEKSVYTYSDWIDGDLFPLFEKILHKKHKSKLVLLHTIGSHWYYNSHYPKSFQKFTPVTQSKIVVQNTPNEMINSYDNSVVYTDYFINTIIEKLKKQNAIIIYLSDHGECLGEQGNWLHASDNDILKNPACIIWYSDLFYNSHETKINALLKNKNKKYNTDFLFHSILSIGEIPTKTINHELNIFN